MGFMPDSAADLFDRLAPGYDPDGSHAALSELLLGQAAEAFAGAEPQKVVDVGTGTGAAAFAAARRFPAAAVTGLDISPAMIERARRAAKSSGAGDRLDWVVAPAVPLPMPAGSVDLVVCASTVHFLGAPALDDWRRVLRAGGLAAFTLPWRDSFRPGPDFAALLPPAQLQVPLPATPLDAENFSWDGFATASVTGTDRAAVVVLRAL